MIHIAKEKTRGSGKLYCYVTLCCTYLEKFSKTSHALIINYSPSGVLFIEQV